MKKILLSLCVAIFVSANTISINDFQSDLYSKSGANNMKKISMSLDIQTRHDDANKAALLDSINIIVSSFYAEDMLTSLGKENFKKTLIKYASKKHGIEIEEIYIISLKIVNEIDIEKIIKAIKDRDLCGEKTLAPNDITKELNKNFGNDFGEN
ncbi:hypothetical protein CIG1485E_0627 [Campylobacter iguaniorum]|uniref:Periplasmic protein n=1 Tax=Campylobacter iguaniorum TaxID=1244531 RepID=A0A076FAI7_9BACT|nr:hypothetical protein [Campylobacter iguaniorum]AII14487.1 hypothetical protein CIG1485E_0627 [Campylobacter iguaniorum]